ncbi:MAG: hypothetical protein OFPII_40180 [Osedax symbiont Rs1]|nr:MAG: hypothetical protein OFPII_40180 [Osedax symbiont Rs1]
MIVVFSYQSLQLAVSPLASVIWLFNDEYISEDRDLGDCKQGNGTLVLS